MVPEAPVEQLGIRVGPEVRSWQEGRSLVLDDTYEHEAWNRSDRTRGVLLGDIWNPHLTEAERDAVGELVGLIGDFNRSTAAPPARGE